MVHGFDANTCNAGFVFPHHKAMLVDKQVFYSGKSWRAKNFLRELIHFLNPKLISIIGIHFSLSCSTSFVSRGRSEMDIIGQFISFILGMLSSWVFWRFLLTTKPNIAISPIIAYSIAANTLTIKVINIGKRQAVDINAFVFLGERSNEKSTTAIYDPELEENHRIALGPIQDLKTPWVLPTATRFKILDAKKILEMLSASKIADRRIVFTQ